MGLVAASHQGAVSTPATLRAHARKVGTGSWSGNQGTANGTTGNPGGHTLGTPSHLTAGGRRMLYTMLEQLMLLVE